MQSRRPTFRPFGGKIRNPILRAELHCPAPPCLPSETLVEDRCPQCGKSLSERPHWGGASPPHLVTPVMKENTKTCFLGNSPLFFGESKWHQKSPQLASGLLTTPGSLGCKGAVARLVRSPSLHPSLAGPKPSTRQLLAINPRCSKPASKSLLADACLEINIPATHKTHSWLIEPTVVSSLSAQRGKMVPAV